MKALTYLLSRIIKNSLREFVKNPGKIVLALIILFGLAMTVLSAFSAPPLPEEARDVKELIAIAMLLYLFIFLSGALRGLSSLAGHFIRWQM